MSVYDPTGMILAFLYREVPLLFQEKYKPNRPGGFGEEVVEWFLPYMGMKAILNFES